MISGASPEQTGRSTALRCSFPSTSSSSTAFPPLPVPLSATPTRPSPSKSTARHQLSTALCTSQRDSAETRPQVSPWATDQKAQTPQQTLCSLGVLIQRGSSRAAGRGMSEGFRLSRRLTGDDECAAASAARSGAPFSIGALAIRELSSSFVLFDGTRFLLHHFSFFSDRLRLFLCLGKDNLT